MDTEDWPALKRDIHAKFVDLTESELDETHGDLNDLEDLMAEKLGKSRDEARRHLEDFLKPYQGTEKEQPPMISDGIKDSVQNLKNDLNAQGPLDGVPSGIQSGVQAAAPKIESGDSDDEAPKTNY